MRNAEIVPRLLLLATVRSYRLEAFRNAAVGLRIAVTNGIDLPDELAPNRPDTLPLDFRDLEQSTARIAAYHKEHPLSAILSVDDSGSLLAARASAALKLPHNDPASALAARDKYEMRRRLQDAGLPTPWFRRYSTADDWHSIVAQIPFPCVVKPTDLNGSRGVIRADNSDQFREAMERLKRIIGATTSETRYFLVESYLPGTEVALEGIMDDGLEVLALFDKPDPLEGPYFEETIYVTPSRLPEETQAAIRAMTAEAANALGLRVGPVHAELRIHNGQPTIVEIAGRSIGGLCSQVLRFGLDFSLEELILRQATGLPMTDRSLSGQASGVMMIPIPEAGLLRAVHGVDDAQRVPYIEGLEISARLNYPLMPLPEGDSYLGFIFARADTPDAVEQALRNAHARLHFDIEPLIQLMPA